MATAVIYGLLASSSFVVGVLLGLVTKPPRRLLAVVIAFGAGVLVSALTFDLMGEAFERDTGAYAIGGFLVGAVIYVLADAGLERLAARSPKRTGRDPQDVVPGAAAKPESKEVAATTGLALLVGALIDGIPESAAIGLSLHAEGRSLGLVLLAAVFLANVPESLVCPVSGLWRRISACSATVWPFRGRLQGSGPWSICRCGRVRCCSSGGTAQGRGGARSVWGSGSARMPASSIRPGSSAAPARRSRWSAAARPG